MKVYIMNAEHFRVPGIIIKVCATRPLAVAEALACANIILNDADASLVDTEEAMTKAIEKLQDEHGAAHCYVEIDEHEVIGV